MPPSAHSRSLRAFPATRALPATTATVLATLLLAAPAGAVPEPGQRASSVRAPHCSLKGSKTITANRHVRVFRTPGLGTVYGCRRTANRAYELGIVGECQNYDEIDGAVVAGDLVALNVRTCSLYASQSRIRLVDLHTGRVRFGAAPLGSSPDVDSEDDTIRGMVLTADGRLAWLGVRSRAGAVVTKEVRRRSHRSARRTLLLDAGADIARRSLHRSGGRAYWRRAGVVRSARL